MADPKNLIELLADKRLTHVFREYLSKAYKNENILFWLEVEIFRTLPPEQLSERSKDIWEKYYEPSSAYEVNIDHKMKCEVKSSMDDPSPSMFDKSQIHIRSILETDCLPSFLQSAAYRDYKAGKPSNAEKELEEMKRNGTRSGSVWTVETFFSIQS